MSRDFIGALLQLNAEKQVPREQLDPHRRRGHPVGLSPRRRATRTSTSGSTPRPARSASSAPAAVVARSRIRSPSSRSTRPRRTIPTRSSATSSRPSSSTSDAFGRIHAQTAKQVVLQRLREAERDVVFDQFAEPRRRDHHRLREPGRAAGDHPRRRQGRRGHPRHHRAERRSSTTASASTSRRTCSRSAAPRAGRRSTSAGPTRASCAASSSSRSRRSTPARSRSRPSRAKPAAAARSPSRSRQEGLDPVGATVGQRGARVQAVVAELGGEKIDVIPWTDDPAVFVANALQPGAGLSASTSTRSTGSPTSRSRSGCSRWPSAARARTPGSRPS